MGKLHGHPEIGLAHQVPIGIRCNSFGAQLERNYYSTTHARMYVFISGLDISTCVMGKSMLFRRSDVERAGGLVPVGQFLTEDNRIGEDLRHIRLGHVLMDDILTQPLGKPSLMDYIGRRIRWIRLRWSLGHRGIFALAFEPVVECFPNALMCSALLYFATGVSPLAFLPWHLFVWFCVDVALTVALEKGWHLNWALFGMTWFVRELLYLPVFAYAVSGRTINWRGQTFYICGDGTAQRVPVRESKSTTLDRHSVVVLLALCLALAGFVMRS